MRSQATCHCGVGNPTGPRNLYAAARKGPIFDAAASGPSIEQSSVMSRNLRWLRAPQPRFPLMLPTCLRQSTPTYAPRSQVQIRLSAPPVMLSGSGRDDTQS